jgi:hypothetical protein
MIELTKEETTDLKDLLHFLISRMKRKTAIHFILEEETGNEVENLQNILNKLKEDNEINKGGKMNNLTIRSFRAEKRLQILIDELEEFEKRLKQEVNDTKIKYLKQRIVFHNEAIVAIIRNLF